MRRAGFTLIEVLAVTMIISMLMSVLLPCMARVRRAARTVKCASNIRQLMLGMAVYETENGAFPFGFDNIRMGSPPGGTAGNACFDRFAWWWFQFTTDYTRQDNLVKKTPLWCPDSGTSNYRLENNVLSGNYGVNLSICRAAEGPRKKAEFVGKPLSTTDMSRSSEAALILDCGYSVISWWHATLEQPYLTRDKIWERNKIWEMAYVPGLSINSDKPVWPGQESDAIGGRHPGKTINIGFADLHVHRTKAEELLVEKTADGYTNLHPAWQPK